MRVLLLALLLAGCATALPELRHEGGLGVAAFAPDGMLLVAGDTTGALVAWDPATGTRSWTAAAHHGCVRALAFSADGSRIASAGEDGSVAAWRAVDGAPLWSVPVSKGAVYEYDGVAFSPDGALVAVSGLDQDVHLLSAADGREVRSFLTEGSTAIHFTADGARVLAGSWSSEVAVFDPSTGIQQANWVAPDAFRGVGSGVSVLALSPDGRILAEGDEDGRVRIWETADGKLLREIEGNGAAVVGIGFDPAFPGFGIGAVFADGTGIPAVAPEERPVAWAALDPVHHRIAWGGWAGVIRFAPWQRPAGDSR